MTDKQETALAVRDDSEFRGFLDSATFNQTQRYAKALAHSQFVPETYQGDEASCLVALQMAMRLGVDPVAFLQKSYVIKGKPSIEATLAIALANRSGKFSKPIDWRFEGAGKDRKCTAYATMAATGREVSVSIDWKTVEGEGWDKKPGSKWLTMPDQMFRYRTAKWLINAHCPEVLLDGALYSRDELIDAGPEPVDVTPEPTEDELWEQLFAVLNSPESGRDAVRDCVRIAAEQNGKSQVETVKLLIEEPTLFEQWMLAQGKADAPKAKAKPKKAPAKKAGVASKDDVDKLCVRLEELKFPGDITKVILDLGLMDTGHSSHMTQATYNRVMAGLNQTPPDFSLIEQAMEGAGG